MTRAYRNLYVIKSNIKKYVLNESRIVKLYYLLPLTISIELRALLTVGLISSITVSYNNTIKTLPADI